MDIKINLSKFICNKKIKLIYIFLFILCIFLFFSKNIFAGEKNVIKLGEYYLKNKQYYNAITEMMRYQFHYPKGRYTAQSLYIEGRAYFYGNNYYQAIDKLSKCHNDYTKSTYGEQALLSMGYMRLLQGSPYFALRTFKEHQYIYPESIYKEKSDLELISGYALNGELKLAREKSTLYLKQYPAGKYRADALLLQEQIDQEIKRPAKSVPAAVAGSIIIPGFGHFYAGNYKIGAFSFLCNAALIGLIYNGVRKKNTFQVVFFSLLELSFYQNSIYGAIRSVREYNDNQEFNRQVKLGIKKRF